MRIKKGNKVSRIFDLTKARQSVAYLDIEELRPTEAEREEFQEWYRVIQLNKELVPSVFWRSVLFSSKPMMFRHYIEAHRRMNESEEKGK